MAQNFEPLDVMQDFLLDVIEQVPDEMTGLIRTMQNTLVALRHELETLERLEQRTGNVRRRLAQQMEYLQLTILSLADSVTKASVVEPLAKRLRQMLGEMRDIDLFGDLDGKQKNANDGAASGRDAADVS